MRVIIDAALSLIKRFEGFRARPYRCPANVPTIGYGTTRHEDGSAVSMADDAVTEAEAAAMLLCDAQRSGVKVLKLAHVTLDDAQYGALVSFVYNLGSGRLQSSTLLRKLNKGDFEGAAAEFPKWCFAGGRKLSGLQARRKAERALFESLRHEHH